VTTLLRLPGDGCRYFARGRCLYEERLNPGLRREFFCAVMVFLEDRFDAFVIRADAFGLSSEEASRIWERRWSGRLNGEWDCVDFIPLPEGVEEAGCCNLVDGVCLVRLPSCPGRCRRYAGAEADEFDSRRV
jgi:hypothetical protein